MIVSPLPLISLGFLAVKVGVWISWLIIILSLAVSVSILIHLFPESILKISCVVSATIFVVVGAPVLSPLAVVLLPLVLIVLNPKGRV